MQHFQQHTGLLVVGHGSREEVGVREFLETVELMRKLAQPAAVEPCFLEFAEPTIAEGFRRLVERGVRNVIVAPVLLFSAGHAQRDIPEAVAAAAALAPDVSTRQAEHLGSEPRLLELSQLRYEQALDTDAALARAPQKFEQTLLVLVGRGSHDAEATAEMHAFAQERAGNADAVVSSSSASALTVEVAFVAMAEPRLTEVLERAAAGPPRRIIVQPHLLFGGVLLDRIADTVREFAAGHPQHAWLLADHLGPHLLLAEALLARASAAE